MRRATDVLSQMQQAGVLDFLAEPVPLHHDGAITGRLRLEVLDVLRKDSRFACGVLYQLHREVGDNLTEFRAHPGEIGHGSLQLVIDKKTGRFYADIDAFNPYSDLVNIGGHAFGEVVPGWLKKIGRLFRRKKTTPTTP